MSRSKKIIELDNVIIKQIVYGDKYLKLKTPLFVRLFYDKNLIIVTHEDLGISALGRTVKEAVRSFYEDFVFLWEEIAKEKDENLDEGALQLKRFLNNIVEEEKTL